MKNVTFCIALTVGALTWFIIVVGPTTELTWSFYSLQDICAPEPVPAFQGGLNNNRDTTLHRSACFSKGSRIVLDVAQIEDAKSFVYEKVEICFEQTAEELINERDLKQAPHLQRSTEN